MTKNVLRAITVPGIVIAGIAVLAMMLIGAADIAATLFNMPIPGALELIQALMVVVIFLALPEVEERRQHIAVDILLARVGLRTQRVLGVVNDLLSLLFFGAMTWQGWLLFWNSWKIREYAPGLISFPVYPSKGLFALGVTLACLVIIANLWRSRLRSRSRQ